MFRVRYTMVGYVLFQETDRYLTVNVSNRNSYTSIVIIYLATIQKFIDINQIYDTINLLIETLFYGCSTVYKSHYGIHYLFFEYLESPLTYVGMQQVLTTLTEQEYVLTRSGMRDVGHRSFS